VQGARSCLAHPRPIDRHVRHNPALLLSRVTTAGALSTVPNAGGGIAVGIVQVLSGPACSFVVSTSVPPTLGQAIAKVSAVRPKRWVEERDVDLTVGVQPIAPNKRNTSETTPISRC
jgi:hypothetical protein